MLRQHAGRNILLVTHGGPARILLLAALRLDLDYFHSVQQSHGSLSCISATSLPNDLRLEVLNETSHTGESLPKLKEGKTGVRLLIAAGDSSATAGTDCADCLAHLLERLPIHCVIAAGPEGVMTAMRLLRYTSRATVETCSESGLGATFESQLLKQRSDELINLLITGRAEVLAGLLVRSMQPAIETPMDLQLGSGLSVVHLPGAKQRPVLQAVNTYQAGSILAGGTV
jgi:probable phosphoglycerate mutase